MTVEEDGARKHALHGGSCSWAYSHVNSSGRNPASCRRQEPRFQLERRMTVEYQEDRARRGARLLILAEEPSDGCASRVGIPPRGEGRPPLVAYGPRDRLGSHGPDGRQPV